MQDKDKAKNKKRSITLNLDGQTIDKLKQLADDCGYDSISGSIRILVKKYADKEINLITD